MQSSLAATHLQKVGGRRFAPTYQKGILLQVAPLAEAA